MAEYNAGFCTKGSIGNGKVDVGGKKGSGGNDSPPNGDDDGDNGGDDPDTDARNIECAPISCFADLTVSDLVSFRPERPRLSMEPDGWMIVGLPANFIIHSSTHTQSGTLLDQPIEVRFTPESYRWSWGDGTTTTTPTPGESWAALGLPEFSTTATSHVFNDKGVYSISVEVSYSVEFRVEGYPWTPVTGTLTGPASVVAALAGDAKTVLVEHECNRNPSGPGC